MTRATSLPTLEQVLRIDFTLRGNSGDYVGEGWSVAEAEHTWATGARSAVTMPVPDREGAYFLQLRATPFVVGSPPAAPAAQRLRLLIDGRPVADHLLKRLETLTIFVPPESMAGDGPIVLTLEHPDACRASDVLQVDDDRVLAIAVHTLRLLRVIERDWPLALDETPPAPPVDLLLLDLEALGEGEDFTRLRAAYGLRPLDLLHGGRWSLAGVVDALTDDFAALTAGSELAVAPCAHANGRETWYVTVRRQGLAYDTDLTTAEVDEAAIRRREQARLTIATRRLRHTLATGRKLLVLHQTDPASDEAMIPLLAALHDRGPAMVLWITPADADHPPGSVELLMYGLLRGYVGPTGPDMAADGGWVAVCRRGWRLWQAVAADGLETSPQHDAAA